MKKDRFSKLGLDLLSAIIWVILIVVVLLFANVSSAPFIYNKF